VNYFATLLDTFSHCLGRCHLSAWLMIAASCPTARGTLCGQPMFQHTLSSYDDRTFAVASSRLWNSFSIQLGNPDIIYGLFRRWLKGHLFLDAWAWRSVTSDKWCLKNIYLLTYLLIIKCIDVCIFLMMHKTVVFHYYDAVPSIR